jgi:hypothetical protein
MVKEMGRRERLFTFPAEENSRRAVEDVAEWEEAARLSPMNVKVRMILCQLLARQGRFDEAIRHCDECLRAQPITGELVVSRRLRIVAMSVRLRRARWKIAHK